MSQFYIAAQEAVASVTGTELPSASSVRGLYVGVGGTVIVTTRAGTVTTFLNVPAGTILPVSARRVETGTTATNIVALY
jgi:hypothetical protein